MTFVYLLTPIIAWLIAGLTKFIIHSIQMRQFAFYMIGYGGMPSTHAAIVSSITTLIALKDGIDNPSFGVAFTLSIIILIDANGLRKHIGRQARLLNQLSGTQQLREKMGHSWLEIGGGLILGCFIGWVVYLTIGLL